jgi:hypothetical protein
MTRKPPNVCEEPEPVRRAWTKLREQHGLNLFHADRQIVFDAIAHELAEQIRRERDEANIPGSPVTPDAIRGMSLAADLIDPETVAPAAAGEGR